MQQNKSYTITEFFYKLKFFYKIWYLDEANIDHNTNIGYRKTG